MGSNVVDIKVYVCVLWGFLFFHLESTKSAKVYRMREVVKKQI